MAHYEGEEGGALVALGVELDDLPLKVLGCRCLGRGNRPREALRRRRRGDRIEAQISLHPCSRCDCHDGSSPAVDAELLLVRDARSSAQGDTATTLHLISPLIQNRAAPNSPAWGESREGPLPLLQRRIQLSGR